MYLFYWLKKWWDLNYYTNTNMNIFWFCHFIERDESEKWRQWWRILHTEIPVCLVPTKCALSFSDFKSFKHIFIKKCFLENIFSECGYFILREDIIVIPREKLKIKASHWKVFILELNTVQYLLFTEYLHPHVAIFFNSFFL